MHTTPPPTHSSQDAGVHPISAETQLDGRVSEEPQSRISMLPRDLGHPGDPSHPTARDSDEAGGVYADLSGGTASIFMVPMAGVSHPDYHGGGVSKKVDGIGRVAPCTSGRDCSPPPCSNGQQAAGEPLELDDVRMSAGHGDVPAVREVWPAPMSPVASLVMLVSKDRDCGEFEGGEWGQEDSCMPAPSSPAIKAARSAEVETAGMGEGSSGAAGTAEAGVGRDRQTPLTRTLISALYEVYLRCTLQVNEYEMDGYVGN